MGLPRGGSQLCIETMRWLGFHRKFTVCPNSSAGPNAPLRPHVALKPMFFFPCVTTWRSTEKYWAAASRFTSPAFFVSQILCLHPPVFFTCTCCLPKIKNTRRNFCNPSYTPVHLGHALAVAETRETDNKPMFWFAFSFSVCILHWLNASELQMFRSQVYRVAASTVSHHGFCQTVS